MTRLVISHVSPTSLVPHPRNPRRISPEAKTRLRRGIEALGLVDPIIARQGNQVVLGGHQRLQVAKEMGMAEVPVVFVDVTDAQAETLLVLLNNPKAQGEWDRGKLAAILSDLDAEGQDATLTGFDLEDLGEMLTNEDLLPMHQETGDEGTEKTMRLLSWGGGDYTVGLTDAEEETLTERYEAYRKRVGSSYGFVADLTSPSPPSGR